MERSTKFSSWVNQLFRLGHFQWQTVNVYQRVVGQPFGSSPAVIFPSNSLVDHSQCKKIFFSTGIMKSLGWKRNVVPTVRCEAPKIAKLVYN